MSKKMFELGCYIVCAIWTGIEIVVMKKGGKK